MQRQPLNGHTWIVITAIIIGLIFIVAGAIITGIAYTEITPPNYDENYDRYIGSSVPRLMGPFVLIFGLFIVLSSAGMMAFASLHTRRQKYGHTQIPTDQDEKDNSLT